MAETVTRIPMTRISSSSVKAGLAQAVHRRRGAIERDRCMVTMKVGHPFVAEVRQVRYPPDCGTSSLVFR